MPLFGEAIQQQLTEFSQQDDQGLP